MQTLHSEYTSCYTVKGALRDANTFASNFNHLLVSRLREFLAIFEMPTIPFVYQLPLKNKVPDLILLSLIFNESWLQLRDEVFLF